MRRKLSYPTVALLLTYVYFCAGKLGLSLAFLNESASAVWPPTGLALAAVLLLGFRVTWPAIFAGAFLVNVTTTYTVTTSLAIAAGNTLEALIGADLALRYAGGANSFRRAGDILRFVFLAALPATAACATIGVTSLAAAAETDLWSAYGPLWLTWWTGDFVSALVVAPLILIWVTEGPPRLRPARLLEAAALLAATFLVTWVVFVGEPIIRTRSYPLEYLGVPLLIWAAFRFGRVGAITAATVMSAVAIWATLPGRGPFDVGHPNESLLLLQMYVGVITLTSLMLAAAVAERRDAESTLRDNERRLRQALADREAAEHEREALLVRERAARAEAERANGAKDRFLAVLSHELRTPLTPILLTASLLERDTELPGELREDIARIRRNVELEARLIDDLLDLTRVTHGKLRLQLADADVHELIRRALETCRGGSGGGSDDAPDISLELGASRHVVRGDASRLLQVFVNLIGNACKFTPAGGTVTIRSRNESTGGNGDAPVADAIVVVDVMDTGRGIAPDVLPKLFAPFEQGDSQRSRESGGLGLGLAIARALVAAHGGTLTAASDGEGRGATFTVRLPAAAHARPPSSHLPVDSTPPDGARKPLRILLVEDHESTLNVLSRLLTDDRHEVTTATTIASAIEAARREAPFDLCISDLGLPDGMGYQLMRTLREEHGMRGIALSGYGMDADVERSREAGFAEHLTKPVDMRTLQAALDRVAAAPKS